MANKLPMAKFSMTMETGKILAWFKQEGDANEKGEAILDIETDKVSIKIESPFAGILLKIIAEKGAVVPVTNTIAIFGESGEDITELLKEVEQEKKVTPPAAGAPRAARAARAKGTQTGGKILASPRAKRLAKENNLDLTNVVGSMPGGEIVEADVIKALAQPRGNRLVPPVKLHPDLTIKGEVDVEGIRKVISDRMYYSLQSAAQLTITTEVDMRAASDFRQQVAKETGERVSFTDILIFVTAASLEKYPKFNASVDPSGEFYSLIETINIGIATAADKGLLVPVLREANKKSLPQVARQARDLTSRTRGDQIALDELGGGTFTITNLGIFGIDAFTPISNPPEIAILGVGRINEKPVAKDGAVVVRPMMVLSLTFDHRIIDGHEGALFLQDLKQLLESAPKLTQLYNKTSFREVRATQLKAATESQLDALAIVIGCGPAGQAFAERLTELGGKVVVVEKDLLGGTCLNRGCIPVRNFLRTLQLKHELATAQEKSFGLNAANVTLDLGQVVDHKNELVQMLRDGLTRSFEQQNIEVVRGTARVVDPHAVEIAMAEETITKTAKYVVIATGTEPTNLPSMPDDESVPLSSSELLDLRDVPSSLTLVGNDAITLTFASMFADLGVHITIISPAKQLLEGFDEEVVAGLVEELELLDVKIILSAAVNGASRTQVAYEAKGVADIAESALVVNLTDRRGVGEELGLADLGIALQNGFP